MQPSQLRQQNPIIPSCNNKPCGILKRVNAAAALLVGVNNKYREKKKDSVITSDAMIQKCM
jgi:hypothetical protein